MNLKCPLTGYTLTAEVVDQPPPIDIDAIVRDFLHYHYTELDTMLANIMAAGVPASQILLVWRDHWPGNGLEIRNDGTILFHYPEIQWRS